VSPHACSINAFTHTGNIVQQSWQLCRRANIGDGHGEKFSTAVTVVTDGSIIDCEKLQGFKIIGPHGLGIVVEQQSVLALGGL